MLKIVRSISLLNRKKKIGEQMWVLASVFIDCMTAGLGYMISSFSAFKVVGFLLIIHTNQIKVLMCIFKVCNIDEVANFMVHVYN